LQFERAVLDRQGPFRPIAVGIATQQFGADRCAADDQDFADRGDSRVGPDIGPGLRLVAGREDFDHQHRGGETVFFFGIGCAGDCQIRDPEVALGPDARNDTRISDHGAWTAAFEQVIAYQSSQL